MLFDLFPGIPTTVKAKVLSLVDGELIQENKGSLKEKYFNFMSQIWV